MLSSLDVMDHKIWFIDRAKSLVGTDPISNNVIYIVLAHLPLNIKQEIIIHKIIYHTIYSQVTPKLEQLNQLLFVVRGKSGVSKSQVIKAIN